MMRPFFLIGYMGCGKTTFGRSLAKALGCRFVDLDFYIEQRFRKSIKEIFAERGEEGFRRLEGNMLREVGEFSDVVIACGGGTPCFGGNMDYMNEKGITVLLQAETEVLMERCRLRPGKRPLLAGKTDGELREFILSHLVEREPFYSRARLSLESSRLENRQEIDETVKRFLSREDVGSMIQKNRENCC